MSSAWSAAASAVARGQHRIASALHVDEAGRTETVVAMLANNARRAPGYWIQLVLAVGIATLGLVLNSTAVVIGAMLVSPLMGPLVELGMGFAVGSSLLVIRASLRVALSVCIAIAAAALITQALPFQEITAEVSARAAPTVLDLLVAMFCALTAAYTTVRPGSDTTAAAAGTAVGIALVPPLCAIGFGIGSGSTAVAGGAALLFTANFSAILVLSALSFLLLGFNQVDAATLELDFVDVEGTRADRTAARLHRRMRALFGSRYGVAMRVLIPLLFLAAVYVPLKHALDEVTWEVRTRDAVRRIVREASPGAVQTQIIVERRTLTLRLLIVGTMARAVALEDTLVARLGRSTGVRPSVTVVAVPNARSLIKEASALARASSPPARATPVEDLRARGAAALAEVWPISAGPRAGWNLAVPANDIAVLTVWHLGPSMGAAGDALLGQALGDQLRAPVLVHSIALPATPLAPQPRGERVWLDSAMRILTEVVATDSAVACVHGPIAKQRRPSAAQGAAIAAVRQTAAARSGRMTISDAEGMDIRVAVGLCAPPEAGPSGGVGTATRSLRVPPAARPTLPSAR
ncbi:MAG: DUF389 domain-containing protein [Gemmatimonadaceae bacterium]